MKYRKKPIEIDALQWRGGDTRELDEFCGLHWTRADARDVAWPFEDDKEQIILYNMLERQWICCPVGHWIIRGIKGEIYPCANEVFEQSYVSA